MTGCIYDAVNIPNILNLLVDKQYRQYTDTYNTIDILTKKGKKHLIWTETVGT